MKRFILLAVLLLAAGLAAQENAEPAKETPGPAAPAEKTEPAAEPATEDRKSTRLNSSH